MLPNMETNGIADVLDPLDLTSQRGPTRHRSVDYIGIPLVRCMRRKIDTIVLSISTECAFSFGECPGVVRSIDWYEAFVEEHFELSNSLRAVRTVQPAA